MKYVESHWKNACHTTFAELKKRLSTTPIPHGSNWALPFHISSEALDTAIGVVLGHQEGHAPYAKYYINKNMDLVELNYTVTEK